jgi:isopenicillin-N N-acyltransferase-like protein
MSTNSFARLHVKGSPHEIGRQHGAAFRAKIQDNVGVYLDLFRYYGKLDRDGVLARARGFVPIVEDFDADLMDEIRGIADGADCALEEIVALNSRTELMFKDGGSNFHHGECTAMAAMPEATADGHMLLGQNWDWMTRIQDNCVVLDIEQKNKPRVLTFTEAGFVGKFGMNEAGLGLCANLLVGAESRPGVQFHLFCRGILNSPTLSEAIGKVYGSQSGASGNYLIAHADGEAIDVEASPNGADYLYDPSGILTHTNHFEGKFADQDQGRKHVPDTVVRYCRSGKLMRRQAGEVTTDTFRAILADHANHPNSICRHPVADAPELERMQSNASLVMDLTEKRLDIAYGNPCRAEYNTLTFGTE